MLTMLLSLTLGVCIFASFHFGAGISVVWAVVWAFVSMFVFQLCAALLIRRAVNGRNLRIQEIVLDTQKRLEAKQQHFMRRPIGSQKLNTSRISDWNGHWPPATPSGRSISGTSSSRNRSTR